MDFNELENYLTRLPEQILEDAAEIVAETAVDYYQDSFRKKAFDGNPWAPAKAPRANGSLLVDSGKLESGIFPFYKGKDKVVISTGMNTQNYAQVHNDGFVGNVTVPAHNRTRKGRTEAVKSHTRKVAIPQRQFMGKSSELADLIHDNLQNINILK